MLRTKGIWSIYTNVWTHFEGERKLKQFILLRKVAGYVVYCKKEAQVRGQGL